MAADRSSMKNIWMLSREYGQLAGAGGVKDVVKQLAITLARWPQRRVRVVMPLYGFIEPVVEGFEPLMDPDHGSEPLVFNIDMDYPVEKRRERVEIWQTKKERVQIYCVGAERFSEKKNVYTYTQEEEQAAAWKKQGEGHFDYFAMNVLLQKAALQLMIMLDEHPDIIHCHDAHTAILPALINEDTWLRAYFRRTGTVVTIHNAGVGYHQEVGDLPFAAAITGLSPASIGKSLLADAFDPFIAAGHYAMMNTVSENYGRELQETNDDQLTGWLGHRLKDLGVELRGITNGIDPLEFDSRLPEKSHIFAAYDILQDDKLVGKKRCREILLEQIGAGVDYEGIRQIGTLKDVGENPLFTFVGRLSEQKGVGVLIAALETFFATNSRAAIALLGTGGTWEESQLQRLANHKDYRGRICFLRGFHAILANRIYSAGDFLLIPSQYEPCGLTDFIAQLFGNLPIVHHVGGLIKVLDGKTGFAYKENRPEALVSVMEQAMAVHDDPKTMRKMQRQAYERIWEEHTWKKVMKNYLELYKEAKAKRLAQV